jgi:hypothetical protein
LKRHSLQKGWQSACADASRKQMKETYFFVGGTCTFNSMEYNLPMEGEP